MLIAAALFAAGVAAAQEREEEEESDEERAEEREEETAKKPPAATELPDRPLMLRLGASHTWESNMFRSPQPQDERIGVAYAGVSVDKRYAQQRFRLDITETAYRYDNFSHLDFNALSYAGAWTWQLTPRIGGALSARRDEALADYSEFRNPGQRNIRTTEDYALGAEARLFGGWRLTGALNHVRNHYSVPFPEEGSYRASGGEAGVKWVAPSTNWVALNLRSLDGAYIDRPLDPVAKLDDGFRRNEIEALASWRITGKSTFEGRVAWIDYRSDHFAERDFSGLAARLRYLWQLTGKLSVNAELARGLEPRSEAVASYRVDERAVLGAVWQPFARTTLRLEAALGESEFRGALPGFAGTPRSDEESRVGFEAEWRALRNLSLKAAVQRYRQSSTDPAASFRGNLVSAGVTFLF